MVDLDAGKKVSTPFPAIVGQASLKRALLALTVETGLSGALVRGEKGTAKSTAVRGLAELLPEQRAVADCPYGCPPADAGGDAADADAPDAATATTATAADQCATCRDRDDPPVETRATPLVTLPLGATRDRVVGTLSVTDALAGDAEFDPGLLARANRGILYVDEVNLLDDHLVDVLLDAAASGRNRVERDGVSVSHPASFTLVGTMNPEEGELRPQLRDRFDLCVEVTGSTDLDERVAILNRVVDGPDQDTRAAFAAETAALRERVAEARSRNPTVPPEFKRRIAALCRDAGVDGHRADFATARAARALAALDGRPKVIESDVTAAAEYALAHRMRSQPFEDAPAPEAVIDDHFDDGDAEGDAETDAEGDDASETDAESDDPPEADAEGDDPSEADAETDADGDDPSETDADDPGRGSPDPEPAGDQPADSRVGDESSTGPGDDAEEDGSSPGDDEDESGTGDDADEAVRPLVPGGARAGVGDATAPTPESPTASGETVADATGRGDAPPSAGGRGATVRTEPAEGDEPIHPAATIRAAAAAGRSVPTADDLRRPVRADDAQTLTVFVTDASASMASSMRAAKGVVLELLEDAYTERDAVALIAVGGEDAETVLPPTTSVSLAARHLKQLPTADRTPLPAGLATAAELVEREAPDSALVVLVTDGRANVTAGSATDATRNAARRLAATDASVLAVDAGSARVGVLDEICAATDATRVPLSALSPETVVGAHHP